MKLELTRQEFMKSWQLVAKLVLSSEVCKGNFYATFVNRSKYNK